MADGGAHMVKMADVEETKSEAADLLYSDDVKKDSHGKMDNADVVSDHHVVSIHIYQMANYLFPSMLYINAISNS